MSLHRYNEQRLVDKVNRLYPVGTVVRYMSADWKGGETVIITSPAFMFHGNAQIRFEGVRGLWHPCRIEPLPQTYIYHGDRLTDLALKGGRCVAVRRADGKCVRGRNGNMLVQFEDGPRVVALGRQLRKVQG